MQVNIFFIDLALSLLFIDLHFFHRNNSNWGHSTIVERHSLKKRGNRSLFDKSMKFGAHVENHKTNKSGYRGASDLTFGDL